MVRTLKWRYCASLSYGAVPRLLPGCLLREMENNSRPTLFTLYSKVWHLTGGFYFLCLLSKKVSATTGEWLFHHKGRAALELYPSRAADICGARGNMKEKEWLSGASVLCDPRQEKITDLLLHLVSCLPSTSYHESLKDRPDASDDMMKTTVMVTLEISKVMIMTLVW